MLETLIPAIPSMSLPQLWAAVVAIVAPLVVALVSRSHWPGPARTVVQIVVSVVVATVTMAIAGRLSVNNPSDWRQWASLLLLVVVVTETAYRLIWKPTGVTDKLEAVGSTTTEPRRVEETGAFVHSVGTTVAEEPSGSVVPDTTDTAFTETEDTGSVVPDTAGAAETATA